MRTLLIVVFIIICVCAGFWGAYKSGSGSKIGPLWNLRKRDKR